MTDPENSEPPSLRDDPSAAGLGRLLDAARHDPGLDAAALERVVARAGAPLSPVASFARITSLSLGGVAVLVAIAWSVWSADERSAPSPSPVGPSADTRRLAPAEMLDAEPPREAARSHEVESVSAPAARARTEERRPGAPSPRTRAPRTAEIQQVAAPGIAGPSEGALLLRARAALPTDPARTLELADEHRATFPDGAMGAEREVLAIEALVALERWSAARSRAARFAHTNPGSPYRARVDAALAREPRP